MRERAKDKLSIPLAERSINRTPLPHHHPYHLKAYDSKIH